MTAAAVSSETDRSLWVRYKYDKALQLFDHIIKKEDASTETPGGPGVGGSGKEDKRAKKGKNKGGKNKWKLTTLAPVMLIFGLSASIVSLAIWMHKTLFFKHF